MTADAALRDKMPALAEPLFSICLDDTHGRMPNSDAKRHRAL
jgi:hypothetical protein